MVAKMTHAAGAVALLVCGLPADSRADDDSWGAMVGLGAAFGPDYPGSDDYEPLPFGMVRIQRGPYYVVLGPDLRANVVPSATWNAGPLLGYGGGRDDVEDDVVDRLPEVDEELWVGAFASYTIPQLFGTETSLGFQLEVMHDAIGDSGTVATFGIEYGVQATQRLSFAFGVATTYADADYTDAYFSVTPAGAAASGLAVYDADAGMRDYSLSLNGMYAFSDNWGIGAIASLTRLVGDAADGPVVAERGDATGVFGGAFLWYRF